MSDPDQQTALAPDPPPPPDEEISSYRDGFKYILWFVKLESFVVLVMTAVVLYTFINYRPQDGYYAIGVQGNEEKLVDVKEPNVNKAALLAWVSASATQATTFGFDNIEETFAKAQKNFSPDGWKSFHEALNRSGLLVNVVKYQQILTSIPISTPNIVAEGLLEGQYRWVVQVVLVQTVRAGTKKATRYVPVTMILVKMPTHENPMGVGINTWFEAN
jgi:intracellular multiplication protein IcmL